MFGIKLNPITRKRLRRFREMRRAWWSFWALVALYTVSLAAELLCNSVPLYVRFEGRSYVPIFRFHPDNTFTGSGLFTRPDYKAIKDSAAFAPGSGNRMIFPPLKHGPYEVVKPARIALPDWVILHLDPEPILGTLSLAPDLVIVGAVAAEPFFPDTEADLRGQRLGDHWPLPENLIEALTRRFRNQAAPSLTLPLRDWTGREFDVSLAEYTTRPSPPPTVRLDLSGRTDTSLRPVRLAFTREQRIVQGRTDLWEALPAPARAALIEDVGRRFDGAVPARNVSVGDARYRATWHREELRFPFRPAPGHWLGLDASGRDVLARILYGLRTSMTFGLVLVFCSLCIGTIIGAIQGYFGGVLDITWQRLIEVWSALPFLYVMILMGSVYGRSLTLLIFCYGLFNWIGISYYMRAELLRLRRQPFVEAARCLGLPAWKIVSRHILPNALVPLITFFPFSLVGAIGALAALDYLGFGLPPPTPSWGELLQQAQSFRWAWWLILYPSLALFTVMLLGVFVGEGVRNAFDPRRTSRIE